MLAAGAEEMEMVAEDDFSAEEAAAKVKKLRQALLKCDQERKEYLAGWQRAKADLINYKREESKRFEDLAKFSAEGMISELIQVLDSFDLALKQELNPEMEKGIVVIRSQLEDILRRRGLEVLQPFGQIFDPAFHESLGEVESDAEEGKVVEVLQKGYLLHGKVLRPARVKISKLA